MKEKKENCKWIDYTAESMMLEEDKKKKISDYKFEGVEVVITICGKYMA